MKAEDGRVVERKETKSREPKPGDDWRDREGVDFPKREMRSLAGGDEDEPNPDELIMVMMPRETWDAFLGLAAKHGGSAAQAISTALKLLEKALEEAENADGS